MASINKKYLLLTIVLFLIEVLIAIYITDSFIRPYGGDFLVVILIYCFVKTFYNGSVITTAMFVLLFSYVVETLQYFKIVKILGLQQSRLANIIIGNSFAWSDLIAYTLGIIFVLLAERFLSREKVRYI